jgi:hypothetical protein
MIQPYDHILDDSVINFLLNLPEVQIAKTQIDARSSGSVYFTISLTPEIQSILCDKLGLDFSNIATIPMRWIKGDSAPHVDRGVRSFEKTHLIYLTDSKGEFRVGENSYPISRGSGYIFNEGLRHETIGTGSEPRLLMGPMSDEGFAVGGGSNISSPGGTTVYIRQTGSFDSIEYKIDDGSWLGLFFPIFINNRDTSLGLLKIQFTMDITLSTTNCYFICNSSHIQFGSTSLKDNGTRPIITIDGVTDYPGFINNGSGSNGYNTVYVFNLDIHATSGSTLSTNAGWIGQEYFSQGANSNYIVNCRSNGPIIDGGGGIVGTYAGSNNGNLTIIGCSSIGEISGAYAGGIVGLYSNNSSTSGSVFCRYCWSEGDITGNEAGGIVGAYAGEYSVIIRGCYSTGVISGTGAGGLVGSNAINVTFLEGNYSSGNISGNGAGGIIGTNSSANIIMVSSNGIYSTGTIGSSAGGIFGTTTGSTPANCYACGTLLGANGQITAGSVTIPATCAYSTGWSSTIANTIFTLIPNPVIGTTWTETIIDQPYELTNMGYTPYRIINISTVLTPRLIQEIDTTITQGQSLSPAIASGKSYTILSIQKNSTYGPYPTITINSTTGVISTTTATEPDIYFIYIRNSGSYNISLVFVTITSAGPIPCLTEDTTILTPIGYRNIKNINKDDYVMTSDNRRVRVINIHQTIVTGNPNTYPYIIPRNSITENYPRMDTRLSGGHLIYYKGRWIHPRLSNAFKQDKNDKVIKYYHVELENYTQDHLVINDGLVVESFAGMNNSRNSMIYRERINKYNNKLRINAMRMNNRICVTPKIK